MTTSSSVNKFRYEGNGVTDTFAFTGRIFSKSDLIVEIILRADDSLVETLDLGSDYTVTINSSESASIVVDSGKIPSSTQDIQIRRALAQTQTLDLPTGTRFPALSVENALDKITCLAQDLSEILDRTITLSVTSSGSAPTVGDLTTDEVVVYDGTSFITDGTTTAAIQGAATQAANAASSASAASGSATLASQWASLTGAQVASTDYSAKEYAIGTTVPEGSAKDWAITPEDTLVDGSDYSAFHWAAKAEAFAAGVDLPALGAANTVLQVNTGGTALEYGLVAASNADIASQAEAEAGTDETKLMNPLRTAQAIAALGSSTFDAGIADNRYYYGFGFRATGSTEQTQTATANRHYYKIFAISSEETFTRVGIDITTGVAGNARLGIYRFANGLPSELVLDAGTIATNTSGGKEVTISQLLEPGVYALTAVFDATPAFEVPNPTDDVDLGFVGGMVGHAGQSSGSPFYGGYNSHTYGALPDPFGGSVTLDLNVPNMWIRKV